MISNFYFFIIQIYNRKKSKVSLLFHYLLLLLLSQILLLSAATRLCVLAVATQMNYWHKLEYGGRIICETKVGFKVSWRIRRRRIGGRGRGEVEREFGKATKAASKVNLSFQIVTIVFECVCESVRVCICIMYISM